MNPEIRPQKYTTTMSNFIGFFFISYFCSSSFHGYQFFCKKIKSISLDVISFFIFSKKYQFGVISFLQFSIILSV